MSSLICVSDVSVTCGSDAFCKAAAAAFDGDFDRLNMLGHAFKAGIDLASSLPYVKEIAEVTAQVTHQVAEAIETAVGSQR